MELKDALFSQISAGAATQEKCPSRFPQFSYDNCEKNFNLLKFL